MAYRPCGGVGACAVSGDIVDRLRERAFVLAESRTPEGALTIAEGADEIGRLRAQLAEATELVEDLTRQGCHDEGGIVDSCGISTYAVALRWLARRKLFRIEHQRGRRVVGRWVERETQ